MNPDEIKQLIEAGLPDAQVQVTGDGAHFEAVVVSPAFAGKGMLAQHRLVYGTLGARMERDIHALSMRTYTPEEWQALAETAG